MFGLLQRGNSYDEQYSALLKTILKHGERCNTRSGQTIALLNASITHDMSEGFPMLTTRKLPWLGIRVELEGFLKGITDKNWFRENGCGFWNEWGRRDLASGKLNDFKKTHPDASDHDVAREAKEIQFAERDIFSGYFWELLHFGAEYNGYYYNLPDSGKNQIKWAVDRLKTTPNCREVVLSGWNPVHFDKYAIPPCYYAWQFQNLNGRLHMTFQQRSADMCLGAPNDFALNALFLALMSRAVGIKPGTIHANYGNAHIYANHIMTAQKQIKRRPNRLPSLELTPDADVFNYMWPMARLDKYAAHEKMAYCRNV